MGTWEAIGLVSSGATLVAFVVAAAYSAFRFSTGQTERMIQSASEAERPALVEAALRHFPVDTNGLTRDQKYTLVSEQIRAHGRSQTNGLLAICFVALLLAAVAAFALSKDDTPNPRGNGTRAPTQLDAPVVVLPKTDSSILSPASASSPGTSQAQNTLADTGQLSASAPLSQESTRVDQAVSKPMESEACNSKFLQFLRPVVETTQTTSPFIRGPIQFDRMGKTELPVILSTDPSACHDALKLATRIKEISKGVGETVQSSPARRYSAYEQVLVEELFALQRRLKQTIER